MGKSPDEQPFLADYKLRLACANSKTTPCCFNKLEKNIYENDLTKANNLFQ